MSEAKIKVTNGDGIVVEETLENFVGRIADKAAEAAAKRVLGDRTKEQREADCPYASRMALANIRFWVLVSFLSGIGVLNVMHLVKLTG